MREHNHRWNFEQEMLPHLDAAYNLARWLTHDEEDAQDVVQEAYMRAFRFFGGFLGENARAWLLRIVRNTCYTWLQQNRPQQITTESDDQLFGTDPTPSPEEALLRNDGGKLLRKALETLPSNFREVLVLRELEEMSYKEISEVTGMPLGTVMSRLSRARDLCRQFLGQLIHENAKNDDMNLKLIVTNPGITQI